MPSNPEKPDSCGLPLASKAYVDGDCLHVYLRDGRRLVLPLGWFKIVKLAPDPERSRVQIIRPGIGLRWPALGYELGVGGLVRRAEKSRRICH